MKVECTDCQKVYNFKDEKVPDMAFTFACKKCGGRIRLSQEKLDMTRAEAEQKKAAAKKTTTKKKEKRSSSLPKIRTDKLKKPFEKSIQMVSEMTEWSEKDWIFTLTKFVAFASIAFLIFLVVLSGLTYFSITNNSRVTFADVQHSVDLKLDPVIKIQAAAPGVKLPGVVKKHFSGDNRPTFIDWMNGLDDSHKKKFIAELELVIRAAQKTDPAHINEYINEFGNLTFRRSIEKPYAKYLFKFGLIIAMLIMVALLGMFSLILIRISTRKTSQTADIPASEKRKPTSKRKLQRLPKRVTSASR